MALTAGGKSDKKRVKATKWVFRGLSPKRVSREPRETIRSESYNGTLRSRESQTGFGCNLLNHLQRTPRHVDIMSCVPSVSLHLPEGSQLSFQPVET